ncbi:MAG: hypothetical protein L7S70_05740 [Pseudomonadales bacterium]|nr:hypothetical protein [Pseudomonadales bacterium]
MPISTRDMGAVRADLDLTGAISLNDTPVRFRANKHSGAISLNDLHDRQLSWQPDIDQTDRAGGVGESVKRYQNQRAVYAPLGYQHVDASNTKLDYMPQSSLPSGDRSNWPNGLQRCSIGANTSVGDKAHQAIYYGEVDPSRDFTLTIDRMFMTKRTQTYVAYDLNVFGYSNGFASGSQWLYLQLISMNLYNAPGLTVINTDSANDTITKRFTKTFPRYTGSGSRSHIVVFFIPIHRDGGLSYTSHYGDIAGVRVTQ